MFSSWKDKIKQESQYFSEVSHLLAEKLIQQEENSVVKAMEQRIRKTVDDLSVFKRTKQKSKISEIELKFLGKWVDALTVLCTEFVPELCQSLGLESDTNMAPVFHSIADYMYEES